MQNKRIAIVPAYEPGDGLVGIASSLADRGFSAVVIDDGSSAACSRYFDEARQHATVLEHDANRGKGEALKTGIAYALDAYGEACTIVTVDADGQHDPDDVVRVCDAAYDNPGSLVLGSRALRGDVPLRSRLGNSVTRLVFRLASGVSVYDTQTGLRAFSGALASKMLQVSGSRYEYEMNVLMQFASDGIVLREVPIRTIYLNGNAASHFDPVRDSFRIYREILKFAASSFTSFLIDYALFCLLLALTGAPVFANIAARIASASANYTMNRTLVFESSASMGRSLAQYAGLAACILACNTLALGALVSLGANPYIAKVAVELALFAVSYAVQHSIIFKKGGKRYETAYLGDRV